jgi:signal transduction histidine kinase
MNIRTKLLLSYLFFVFLGSVNIYIALQLYKGYNEIDNFYDYFYEIRVKTQQNIAQSQHFLLYETLNPRFFEKKESNILSKRSEIAQAISLHLTLLKNNPLAQRENFMRKADSLGLLINHYEQIFSDLVDNIYKRGFKDAGLEGKMREYAHQLEEGKQIALSQILILRRWEKDYLIRHDTISIKRFSKEMNNTLMQFRNNQEIRQKLISYQECFRQMVLLEEKIGKNTDTGLTNDLRNQSILIEKHLVEYLAQVNHIQAEATDNLMRSFWVNIVIMLGISILLSVYISRKLTKPVLDISEMLNDMVESNFDKNIPVVRLKGKDEIAQMSAHLALMIQKMQESFTFLNYRNQEISEKNLALVTFNEQILESEKQLKRINQIKDKFFSIIAHDLRGPFNTLRGFIGILMNYSEGLTKDEIKDLTTQLHDAVKNVSNLTNNLLEWALTQTEGIKIELKNLNLHDTFEDSIHLLYYEAHRKAVKIQNNIGKNVQVKADQNILYFVVRNLLSNALKFSNENGEIKLESAEVNGLIYTQVIDNGIGMPKELEEKLFMLGEKVSREGTGKEKGTGIGLLMCKDFLNRSGGDITVSSEVGRGSIFTFMLPVAENATLEKLYAKAN